MLFSTHPPLHNLQWNLSFGTPLFKGHLHSWETTIWSRKNVHIVFSVTSIEGRPLIRGKGHIFLVPKPEFNYRSWDTLALIR